MLFTGDFVFVGDIGRPDLLEKAAGMVGTQDKGAEQMYQSINLFANLPEFIQVWPGHGAGSACGKALGAVPSTTVGYEKKRNWAFSYGTNKAGFIDFLLTDQPEPPKYFAKMKELNKVDRPLLTELPTIKEMTAAELKAAMDKGVKLIDTRNKQDFEKGFIPGSIKAQSVEPARRSTRRASPRAIAQPGSRRQGRPSGHGLRRSARQGHWKVRFRSL